MTINLRILTLLFFFLSLLGLAAIGFYFLYNTLSTKAKPLTDSVVELLPVPEDEYDYNFPVDASVAGAQTVAEYEYGLFNIPIDYSTYANRSATTSQRYTAEYTNSLPMSKIKTLAFPVLGFEASPDTLAADGEQRLGAVMDNRVQLVTGPDGSLFVTCNNCLNPRDISVGDVLELKSDDRSYYYKIVDRGEVYQDGQVQLDNLRKKHLLVLGQDNTSELIAFELRAVP